jgi:hypothetical protein
VNWFSNNWKLLFEGVGGTAAVAIIGYVCKLLFWPQSSGQDANLTAQGARVSDSPVASGSDIIQTVGGTHHHHYPPAVVSQPPAIELEPAPERPRPNLRMAGGKKILVRTGLDGVFYQSEVGRAQGEAVVAHVTNDARRELRHPRAGIQLLCQSLFDSEANRDWHQM